MTDAQDDTFNKIFRDLDAIRADIERLDLINAGVAPTLTIVKAKAEDIEKDCEYHMSKIIALDMEMANLPKQIESNIGSAFEDWKAPFIEELKKLQDEMESAITLKDVRDEFSKKMENVTLDSSNALLLSRNSNLQVATIEKKIEFINNLLKKHELTK